MIRLEQVSLHFPGRLAALKDIQADWKAGEVVALLGPNGAGKSTLLQAMAGLHSITGQILVEGKKLIELQAREKARVVCYLPQQIAYPQPFRAWEVVMMARFSRLGLWGSASPHDHQQVDDCLRRAGALELRERTVNNLSGGEIQRVRWAQALAQEAPWMLLDEPTSALDWHQQLELIDLVKELKSEGKSLLMALHDFNFARRVSDRIWLLDRGRLCLQGEPDEVLRHPEFEGAFGVKLDFFQNSLGDSVCWPRKLTSEQGSATLSP